ncbi:MAG: hypothetical protein J6X55_01910 [Victivallales bacterium]|nr:hypothetical protein [Victivallales bacterium]
MNDILGKSEDAAYLIDAAIRLLREKPVNSTLTERLFLLDEAWKDVQNLPQPLQQGIGLFNILSKASLPVDPHDFLLGRYIDKVPDAQEEARLQEIWKDNHYRRNPISYRNYGHVTLDFPGACRMGLPGYVQKVESRIQQARDEGENDNCLNQLEGMKWVFKAIIHYINRYADAAQTAGKPDCAAVCRRLVAGPPETFRDALQLMLFIFTVYIIYAGADVACLTFGRVDDDLLDFYEHDIATGRLTREQAGWLIDDFYSKCSLHLARGEHQMANAAYGGNTTGWARNAGFDSPTYILLGGYSNSHDYRTNPLTRLFLERIQPLLKNPVVIFRRTKDTPEDIWMLLCDKVRQNASILIYNDDTMVPAFRHVGVEPFDAINYSIHPCNWADISGGSAIVFSMQHPTLPVLLLDVLNSGRLFSSMDDIYKATAEIYRNAYITPDFEKYRKLYRNGTIPSNGLLSLTDCFTEGTIDRARGCLDGGVKYPALYLRLRYIGTAADMLAAVDQLVFKQKLCSLGELMAACANDFTNASDLYTECRRAPKYGRDDDTADTHAVRLMNTLLDVIDEEAVNENGIRDVITLNVTISDSCHITDGAHAQATPDGRHKGMPFSENLSPSQGQVTTVTALMRSVSKLPFQRLHSGAFNLRLRPNAVDGTEGLQRLAALLKAYFEQGGMQAQLSIADTAMLREAQKHPENYSDLTVRITGYSAIFVDMSSNAQNEIIRRDEMG